MSRQQKIKCLFKKDKFNDLVNCLDDLSKISDIIKFKIDENDILIYSLVGETAIYAFKTYTLPTKEYIEFLDEFEIKLDFIADNAKKFVKNLKFFSLESDIKALISYKEMGEYSNTRSIKFNDKRFTYNHIGSEPFKVKDIDKIMLNRVLDPSLVEWEFNISKKDFDDVKKLSAISDSKIITFSTDKTKLKVGEHNWNLTIGEVDEDKSDVAFPKKYLKSVNPGGDSEGHMNFKIYGNFILFNLEDVNLMVSFEQNFDDEDY